jgi:hypothetical protein
MGATTYPYTRCGDLTTTSLVIGVSEVDLLVVGHDPSSGVEVWGIKSIEDIPRGWDLCMTSVIGPELR